MGEEQLNKQWYSVWVGEKSANNKVHKKPLGK